MNEDIKKLDEAYKYESELQKKIWNEAIEEAAKWLETADRNNTNDADEIRKLKK